MSTTLYVVVLTKSIKKCICYRDVPTLSTDSTITTPIITAIIFNQNGYISTNINSVSTSG